MSFENYLSRYDSFIFGFDNVLYPEKDYQLQVFYLFSEFMAYQESIDAKPILNFFQQEFENHGIVNLFEKAAKEFNLPEKYKSNFERLHENARLPLKLLLFQKVLDFLQQIVVERKAIFLLIQGSPMMQINKLKQMEWHGLEKYLKTYFVEEIASGNQAQTIKRLIDENNLQAANCLYLGNTVNDEKAAQESGVEFLFVTKLL